MVVGGFASKHQNQKTSHNKTAKSYNRQNTENLLELLPRNDDRKEVQTRKKSVFDGIPCVAEGLQATLSYQNIATLNNTPACPETCRSWLVLVVAAFAQALTFGIGYSSGIFTTLFQNDFDVTTAQASFAFALVNGVANLTGPLANGLANLVGHRETFCIGTVLAVCGFIFTSYCNTLWQLYASYGCFVGVAFGAIRVTSIGVIGHYFERHRNLAASVAFGGGSVGCVALPVIITVCNNNFGWRYTMLVFAVSCLLLGFAGVVVERRADFRHRTENGNICLKTEKSSKNMEKKNKPLDAEDSATLTYYAKMDHHDCNPEKKVDKFGRNKLQLVDAASDNSRTSSIKKVFDVDLLCNRKFLVLLIFNFFSSGFLIYHMITVEHAQQSWGGHVSAAQAPYLISVVGVGDVVGKLMVIFTLLWLAPPTTQIESSPSKPSRVWAQCMAVCAVSSAAGMTLTAYAVDINIYLSVAVSFAFGLSFGIEWSCYPSLVMETFGGARLTACQGYANFVCGVSQILFLYAGAQIVDAASSFIVAYWFGASCLVLSAMALLILSRMKV